VANAPLFDRAIAEFALPEGVGDGDSLDPLLIKEIAVATFRARGIPLLGPPPLVDWALETQMSFVREALNEEGRLAAAQRRAGRPRNLPSRNVILAAAYSASLFAGMSKTAARHAAAKRLGGGITKNMVEKGERAFRRQTGQLTAHLPRSEAVQFGASLLMITQNELDRIESEIFAERRQQQSRRFARPSLPCFGAPGGSSVDLPTP
jgi:hypothetical protein